jgi:hypothetical protein
MAAVVDAEADEFRGDARGEELHLVQSVLVAVEAGLELDTAALGKGTDIEAMNRIAFYESIPWSVVGLETNDTQAHLLSQSQL